ncbi:PDZ domain-containing protein [Mesorhizobium sp. M0830]|uniref:PDZ domain-containing protein n=1 Tax=Mesorhizobium sp. M0830 TaxID=2957008 RepID=UPI003339D552
MFMLKRRAGKFSKAVFSLAWALHLAAIPISYSTNAYALNGDVKLPKPYISRAIEAVLLPINGTVRKEFKLKPHAHGVLVLSVKPGGTGEKQGIKPGDVIAKVHGHKIYKPIDVDTVVYHWAKAGKSDFRFDCYRDGKSYNSNGTITLSSYETAVDVVTVATWTSWSVATAFSYSEFYSEYSQEMTATYESSETTVEATASSEEFTSEANSEATDESADSKADATTDGASDSATEPSDQAEASGTDDTDAPAAEDNSDGGDDGDAADDSSGDDDSGGGDDGGGDDGGGDDSGGDE